MHETVPLYRFPYMGTAAPVVPFAVAGFLGGFAVYTGGFHQPGAPFQPLGAALGAGLFIAAVAIGIVVARRVTRPRRFLQLAGGTLQLLDRSGRPLGRLAIAPGCAEERWHGRKASNVSDPIPFYSMVLAFEPPIVITALSAAVFDRDVTTRGQTRKPRYQVELGQYNALRERLLPERAALVARIFRDRGWPLDKAM